MSHPTPAVDRPVTSSARLAEHLAEGFSQSPRALSSKYLYDDEGSRIFQQIMQLPEYYPTRTEFGLLETHRQAIVQALKPVSAEPFYLIELGAGDGLKTKILLRHLLETNTKFTYVPVDISPAALEGLATGLQDELPALQVETVVADYADALQLMAARPGRKVVLFLGSNIGNFFPDERQRFLRSLAHPLSPDDRLLVGFDLRKDPRLIRAAYDDAQGVTAAFNLNLLARFNRELGADFDLAHWQHFTDYEPLEGVVRSFLVSTQAQRVQVAALDQHFDFAPWEIIHTENSYKFTPPQIEELAQEAGLRVAEFFTDERDYFADVIMAPK